MLSLISVFFFPDDKRQMVLANVVVKDKKGYEKKFVFVEFTDNDEVYTASNHNYSVQWYKSHI